MINVLLTDDHELVRTGIRRLLEDSKQVNIVGEADCGETALKLVQELNPDVILMDVNMPGMEGPEVLSNMRRDSRLEDIPVIFMTASQEPPESSDKPEGSFAGIIKKPFDPMSLGEQIQRLLAIT